MEHKKLCRTAGCGNLTANRSGYCEQCRSQRGHYINKLPDSRKQTDLYKKGYQTYRWKTFAKAFLKDHPVCERCGAPSEVCDHKTMTARQMVDAFGRFTYNPEDFQALCIRCNNRKGREEDRLSDAEYFSMKAQLEKTGGPQDATRN